MTEIMCSIKTSLSLTLSLFSPLMDLFTLYAIKPVCVCVCLRVLQKNNIRTITEKAFEGLKELEHLYASFHAP